MEKIAIQFSFLIFLGLGSYDLSGQQAPGDSEGSWSNDFELVEIESAMDHHIQKAYFYRSTATDPAPLIVSLHTWSGDYTQKDTLAVLCRAQGLNYIHPDFRGVNNTKNACCSELAINDIDESIAYAIKNANVDTLRIYIIGHSGMCICPSSRICSKITTRL